MELLGGGGIQNRNITLQHTQITITSEKQTLENDTEGLFILKGLV